MVLYTGKNKERRRGYRRSPKGRELLKTQNGLKRNPVSIERRDTRFYTFVYGDIRIYN